jgi:hypothetical protein
MHPYFRNDAARAASAAHTIAVQTWSPLTDGEMVAVDALHRGESGRTGPHPDTADWVS